VNEYADADFYLSHDSLLTRREFNCDERNEYTIYIEATDQFNHVYQERFSISILENNVVSRVIDNNTSLVEIYPNPSAGRFILKGTETGTYALQIIDTRGIIVYQAVIENNGQPAALNVGNPGFYMLRMISPSGKLVLKKLIVN
jgi:hypothetical protein